LSILLIFVQEESKQINKQNSYDFTMEISNYFLRPKL